MTRLLVNLALTGIFAIAVGHRTFSLDRVFATFVAGFNWCTALKILKVAMGDLDEGVQRQDRASDRADLSCFLVLPHHTDIVCTYV